jgi:hypothetical protein
MPTVIVLSIVCPEDDPEVAESTIAQILEATGYGGISTLLVEHATYTCVCCGNNRCDLNEAGLCTNCESKE